MLHWIALWQTANSIHLLRHRNTRKYQNLFGSVESFKIRSMSVLRILVQAVALVIFVYQMMLALNKYIATITIATLETKNIERAEQLPDIYFCVNGDSMDKNLQKHGYIDSFYILRGQVIEIEE